MDINNPDHPLNPNKKGTEEYEALMEGIREVRIKYGKSKLPEAIQILTEELKKDKSEGSYYYSWQANIAVAFQDAVAKHKRESGYDYIDSKDIHKISNEAAKNFLNLLIK